MRKSNGYYMKNYLKSNALVLLCELIVVVLLGIICTIILDGTPAWLTPVMMAVTYLLAEVRFMMAYVATNARRDEERAAEEEEEEDEEAPAPAMQEQENVAPVAAVVAEEDEAEQEPVFAQEEPEAEEESMVEEPVVADTVEETIPLEPEIPQEVPTRISLDIDSLTMEEAKSHNGLATDELEIGTINT